eukprot:6377205-Pyramimonas_sp.AAC.1
MAPRCLRSIPNCDRVVQGNCSWKQGGPRKPLEGAQETSTRLQEAFQNLREGFKRLQGGASAKRAEEDEEEFAGW